jgi:predicted metalloprotease with PDZ domain
VHLALPDLARSHHWLEEGIASYVEPIARVRAGLLEEADVWREWLDNLALGLPEAGDRGLDHTPTWARTYWGGALFCFQADLEIRKQTGGRLELRDALRGILAQGGNLTVDWPIERVLRAGDAATGLSVLASLYAQLKDQPVSYDLERAWRELGVSERAGELRFDDQAPLAELRRHFVRGR